MIFFILLFLCSANIPLSFPKSIFLDQNYTSGLIGVNNETNSQIFYWHFPSISNPTSDPIIFFLSGFSSIYQVFNNSGPFLIHENSELSLNSLSWNSKANLVYIDSPSCIGFSSTNSSDQNATQTIRELSTFFFLFYEQYPEYNKRKTLLAGDSYAGHYIPALLIQDSHLENYYSLKGIILIGGWVNSLFQASSIGDYLLEKGLMSLEDNEIFKKQFQSCDYSIQFGPKSKRSVTECKKQIKSYQKFMEERNIEYYRNPQLDKQISQFLNQKSIKKLLGVDPDKKWKLTNLNAEKTRWSDTFVNYSSAIHYLLWNGIRVKILYGKDDIFWNFKGGLKWVNAMFQSQSQEFSENNLQDFEIDGIMYGQCNSVDKLEFFIIDGAGHQIAQYQPLPVFKIVSQLIYDIR